MTFQEMLKERLSPTDWQRLQAFTVEGRPGWSRSQPTHTSIPNVLLCGVLPAPVLAPGHSAVAGSR